MDHTLRAIDTGLGGLSHAVAAMGDLAVAQVRASVDVFVRHDLAGAAKVVRADDALDIQDAEIDERHDSVLREIVAGMVADPSTVEDSTHLLFIAKNLERIGDHATNIAELVHYQITGTDLSDRPKL